MRTDFSDKMSSCVLDIVDDFSPPVSKFLLYLKVQLKSHFVSNLFSDFFHQNYFSLLGYIKTPLYAFIIYLV